MQKDAGPISKGGPGTPLPAVGRPLLLAITTCQISHVSDGNEVQARVITVFLADDNLIVREGVRALIDRHQDLSVVGVAADFEGTVNGATDAAPQVLVTD